MGTMAVIKQGSTLPVLSITLSNAAGAIDLSLATSATLIFRLTESGVLISRAGVITSPASAGEVTYTFTTADWDSGDFDVGDYQFICHVVFTGGGVLPVPTIGFGRLVVHASLGA